MLGTELVSVLEHAGVPFVGTDKEVSILEPDALRSFVQNKPIRWIINCAAYTAVDKAEDEVALCTALNSTGPENLASVASTIGASLVHISTDYVFDGKGITAPDGTIRPYRETDPVAPVSVYGRTKALGEEKVTTLCPSSIIIRTAWLYGEQGANFVHTMLRLMKERESVGVVSDQRGTPTWAKDLAKVIYQIITLPEVPSGIYHYTHEGETTWYDFAREIYRLGREYGLLKHDCTLVPLTTDQYPTKAHRPAYSVLSKEKIKALGIPVPHWKESLSNYIQELAEKYYAKL